MAVNMLRAAGKRLLAPFPGAFRAAQRIYIRRKLAADRRAFETLYPDADYVLLTEEDLAGLAAAGYHSQYGQDRVILERLFAGKAPGYYVDIGCNEPIALSNSYALEQRGWHGLAIDPMRRVQQLWKDTRSADFRQAAIADKAEDRDYIEIKAHHGWEHALSGFKGFVRSEDMRLHGYTEYKVRSFPLADLLSEGQAVDIIMIDVEGAEEIVLRGIDFDKVRAPYVMIENVADVGGSEGVREIMKTAGYRLIMRIGAADDLFERIDAA